MQRRNEIREIVSGCLFVLLINLLPTLILILSGMPQPDLNQIIQLLKYGGGANLFVFTLYIDLGQFLYVIPWSILLATKRQWGFMKGVILGALFTILLNYSGCYLVLKN